LKAYRVHSTCLPDAIGQCIADGMKVRLADCMYVKARGALQHMVVPSACMAVIVKTAAAAQSLLAAPLCSPSQVRLSVLHPPYDPPPGRTVAKNFIN
jgi:hypothetical protein